MDQVVCELLGYNLNEFCNFCSLETHKLAVEAKSNSASFKKREKFLKEV